MFVTDQGGGDFFIESRMFLIKTKNTRFVF